MLRIATVAAGVALSLAGDVPVPNAMQGKYKGNVYQQYGVSCTRHGLSGALHGACGHRGATHHRHRPRRLAPSLHRLQIADPKNPQSFECITDSSTKSEWRLFGGCGVGVGPVPQVGAPHTLLNRALVRSRIPPIPLAAGGTMAANNVDLDLKTNDISFGAYKESSKEVRAPTHAW